jgi:plastocyanin
VTVNVVGINGALSFSPNPATLPSGQMIVWHNVDTMSHHVVWLPESQSDSCFRLRVVRLARMTLDCISVKSVDRLTNGVCDPRSWYRRIRFSDGTSTPLL